MLTVRACACATLEHQVRVDPGDPPGGPEADDHEAHERRGNCGDEHAGVHGGRVAPSAERSASSELRATLDVRLIVR